jgi:hypothetical protein
MSAGLACRDQGCPTFFHFPNGQSLTFHGAWVIHTWRGESKGSTAVTLGQSLTDTLIDLWETYQECSSPNWDGYRAMPVTRETFNVADRFLRSLPVSFPVPDVDAEPGGEIGFEWRKHNNVVAAAVSHSARLHYAAAYGRETIHGSIDFEGALPPHVLELIVRIMR